MPFAGLIQEVTFFHPLALGSGLESPEPNTGVQEREVPLKQGPRKSGKTLGGKGCSPQRTHTRPLWSQTGQELP